MYLIRRAHKNENRINKTTATTQSGRKREIEIEKKTELAKWFQFVLPIFLFFSIIKFWEEKNNNKK